MSLKDTLYNEIKNAYPNMFSLDRVEKLSKELGHKMATAERKLRLLVSEGSRIRPIRNEKGYIMGYIYQQSSFVREYINDGLPGINLEQAHIEQVKQSFKDFEAKQQTLI